MLKTCLLFVLLWTLAGPVWAEIKTFTVKAQAFIGDNQTKNEARQLATLEAKRQALEQAGTYVESLTLVKNAVLSKDEILAFTGGVSKTELLSEKALAQGGSFGLEVVARVTVDTRLVEQRIQYFARNREALEKEKALLARNKALEQEIRAYQAQLAKLKQVSQVQQLRANTGQKLEKKLQATDWFRKGYEAYLRKEYDLALAHYNQALQCDPGYADVYHNRGVVHYERQAYPLAIAEYSLALRYNPRLSLAYNGRGVAYKNLQKDDLALADYQQALRLKPDFAAVYNNRGNLYKSQRQYPLALADYQQALRLQPDYAAAYSNRGSLYYELQDYPRALADFNQALTLLPTMAESYNYRGNTYHYLQEPEKALADWRKACELGLQSTCEWLKQTGK